MLNNISWASYAYAVGITLCIYYLFTFLVFYKNEIKNLFVNNKVVAKLPNGEVFHVGQNATAIDKNRSTDTEYNSETQELLLSLQSLIKKAGALKYPKEELLLSLQLKLQNYPSLTANRLKSSINIFIKEACENNCSIHLLDDEIEVLWGMGVGGVS